MDRTRYKKERDHIKDMSLELGKMPPQAIEMEEAVLGALMLDKESYFEIQDILSADHFYKDSNQKIFAVIAEMGNKKQPIDILTVVESLRKKGDLEKVGGPYYISQLTNKVATTAHIEIHAKIVAEKYIKRELIRVASTITHKAFDESEDFMDLVNFSEKAILAVNDSLSSNEPRPISQSLIEAKKTILEAKRNREERKSVGVPSGLKNLDKITLGWQRGDLIIVGGRPASGKSSVTMNFSLNATNYGLPVGFFSLEMSELQLNTRLISGQTDYTPTELRGGVFADAEQLDTAVGILSESKLFIDDCSGIHINELCAKARRMRKKHGVELIVIDYLQLITGGREYIGNREQEISYISRTLKSLAKELNIPIIALAQLNRGVENRQDKKPKSSDLRESGAIEQDADIIMFVHRPAVYGEGSITVNNNGEDRIVATDGLGMLVITKHRNGMLDDVLFKHNTGITQMWDFKFDELDI